MTDLALKFLREEVLGGEQLTGEGVRYFINEIGKQTRHLIISNADLEDAIINSGPDEDFQEAIFENQEVIMRRKSQMKAYLDAVFVLDPVYCAAHSEELADVREEFHLASPDVPQWTGPQQRLGGGGGGRGAGGLQSGAADSEAEVRGGEKGPGPGPGTATGTGVGMGTGMGMGMGALSGPGSVLEIVVGRRRQPELEARYLLGEDRAPAPAPAPAATAKAAAPPTPDHAERAGVGVGGGVLLESDADGGLFL